ncbi:hypothetical protein MKX01_013764 [Papaver californicum]|nr:hypothetical protein MKX01_013764 [Papaver californicum]
MYRLTSTSLNNRILNLSAISLTTRTKYIKNEIIFWKRKLIIRKKVLLVSSNDSPIVEETKDEAVQKTAATFAPRASTAMPGSTLYTVFEVQAYISMLLGGLLFFNVVFPSNEPDLWRLMGMWSIWMFTIPSLRARDCSKNEKEALNYLFILVPLLSVLIPFFVKSFSTVWAADTIAFFGMYAWKMGWIQKTE